MQLTVRACPDHAQCHGVLCFDPNSGPNWKLTCNRCNHLIKFAKKAHKVKLLSGKKCEECDATLLSVDFHKDHNPLKGQGQGQELEGAQTVRKGCLFCDDVLSNTAVDAYGNVRKLRTYGKKGRGGKPKSKDGKPTLQDLLQHNG